MQKEAATEEGRTALVKKEWLTADTRQWPYLQWDVPPSSSSKIQIAQP